MSASQPQKKRATHDAVIACDHVTLGYAHDSYVLRDVSFQIKRGGFYFLTGESGAGKSTLLNLLALRMLPLAGNYKLFGQSTASMPADELPYLRRKVSMVFQDFRLLDHLSVAENVALPLKIAGKNRQTTETHVKEMLGWIGMENAADAMPKTLSGGQKQRVAIARAVVNQPDIILADEPTGNLDPKLSIRCMHLFEALHRQGTTLIIATHDESMVARMGHPTLHLSQGNLAVRSGATQADAA